MKIVIGFCKKLLALFGSELISSVFSELFEVIKNCFRSPHDRRWTGHYFDRCNRSCPVDLDFPFSTKKWMCGSAKVTFPDGEQLKYIVTAEKSSQGIYVYYHSAPNRPSFEMDLSYSLPGSNLSGLLHKTSVAGRWSTYRVHLNRDILN